MSRVHNKVAAGKVAREIIRLIEDEADGLGDPTHLWQVVASDACSRIGCEPRKVQKTPSQSDPMTDAEARSFEDTVVKFGVHNGLPVSAVPPGYWLAIRESEFNKQLDRYLASEHFSRLQEDPE